MRPDPSSRTAESLSLAVSSLAVSSLAVPSLESPSLESPGVFTTLRAGWTDLVFGGRCVGCEAPGLPVCAACRSALPTPSRARPTPTPPGLLDCWASGEYAGLLGRAVVAHKEEARFAYAGLLAERLAAATRAGLEASGGVRGRRVVLVPVPSRPGVVRARGDDPTARMVAGAVRRLRRALPEASGVRALSLLRSSAGVQDQAGLDSRQRALNLAGSMSCPTPGLVRLLRWETRPVVVICDDVMTTGATLREAQRALTAVGVPVRAAAVVAAVTRRRATMP